MRQRRFIVGVVLGGLFLGLLQNSLSLAACRVAAKADVCCCGMMQGGKSDCCPMKKSTKCPAMKKSDAAPLTILPARTVVSVVLLVEPIPAVSPKPFTDKQRLALFQGLAPPNAVLDSSPTFLRAPPALS